MTAPTADDLRPYDPALDGTRHIGWFWRFLVTTMTAASGRWTIKGRFRRLVEFEMQEDFYVVILTWRSKQAMIFWDRKPNERTKKPLWGKFP